MTRVKRSTGSYYLLEVERTDADNYTTLYGPYAASTTRDEIKKRLLNEAKYGDRDIVLINLYLENGEIFLD